jgi:hypothetical protein
MGTNTFLLGNVVSGEEVDLLVLEKKVGGDKFEYFALPFA